MSEGIAGTGAGEGAARKLLALDGGGIRGLITIQILAKMEKILGNNRPDFRLAQYFDYIAGTSTGAVIGTLLSLGKSAAEIGELYERHGKDMFDKSFIAKRLEKVGRRLPFPHAGSIETAVMAGKNLVEGWLGKDEAYSAYEDKDLKRLLQEQIGPNQRLDSNELKTLLLVILSNATTDAPWPVSSNPTGMDFEERRGIPLWQLVRASTAAPLYFPPEQINVGGRDYVFVDGGVTSYNNPAFQLFLHATHPCFKLRWPTGENSLLLVSIGTGLHPNERPGLRTADLNFFSAAKGATKALFNAALFQQDLLCRVFGRCRKGDPLDDEVGDLTDSTGLLEKPLFTYLRYNATLTERGLHELGLPDIDWKKVQKTDAVGEAANLVRIGQSVAARKVAREDFNGFPAGG